MANFNVLASRPAKLTVRLSADDAMGLDATAADAGLTPNAWAAALIRRRLHDRPGPLRRIGDRHSRGESAMADVLRSAYREAAKAAFTDQGDKPLWEVKLVDGQTRIRSIYLAQAKLLLDAKDMKTRELGRRVEAFVRSMPQPDSQRLALARELRAANRTMSEERNVSGPERTR